MGENITVVINGKEYVSKAATSAKGAIENLGKTVQASGKAQATTLGDLKAGWLAFYAIAAKAAREVVQLLGDMNNAYNESELAGKRLEGAERTNAKLTDDFAESMAGWAGEMQFALGVGDELIKNQGAMAGALGRNESQIKAMTIAAADWAATGKQEFGPAMDALTKSFGGNVTMLARMIPEVKDLTKEQLAAGAAVDIVAKKFEGLAASTMTGLEGSRKLAALTADELKETLGKMSSPIEVFFNRGFAMVGQQLTKELNKGLTDADTNAWFRKFVGDLYLAVDSIHKFIAGFFTGIGNLFMALVLQAKLQFQKIFDASKVAATEAEIAAQRRKMIADAKAALGMGPETQYLKKALDAMNAGAGKEELKRIADNLILQDKANKDAIIKAFSTAMGALALLPRDTKEAVYAGSYDGTEDGMNAVKDPVAEAVAASMKTQVADFEDYMTAMMSGSRETRGMVPAAPGGEATPAEDTGSGVGQQVADLFGPVISALSSGNYVGAIFAVISQLTALAPILNFVGRLLAEVDTFLLPLVEMLQPILGFVTIIGRLLGAVITPILQILAPFLSIIAWGLAFLYNYAIMPITNAIIFVIKVIQTVVAAIFNAIAWFLNLFGAGIAYMEFPNFTTGYLEPIDMTDLENAGGMGEGEEEGTGVYGGNVTQQQAPDYYIYVHFAGANIVGAGGMREAGGIFVQAIQEHIDFGGEVQWLEAEAS